MCAGPNIHGGAEALRAGRLDVPDLFASFWIKPKRRRTVKPEYRSVKKAPVTIPNQKSTEPTLFPIKDNIPVCVGPNIHGGAEAMRAGRLDVLDLFASFWIKPKRRSTVKPENRSVKEAPVTIPNQKSTEPTLFPIKDNIPVCVGPNIHGGAEAWRAGRLDVLDLFASFWIKPKRRRTVKPEIG